MTDDADLRDVLAQNLAHYHHEMKEFGKMEEAIKDMDYYKAEAEAARNGQTAAMEFADAKKAEAAAWREKFHEAASEVSGLKGDVDKLMGWFSKALVFIMIAFIAGILIGAWFY